MNKGLDIFKRRCQAGATDLRPEPLPEPEFPDPEWEAAKEYNASIPNLTSGERREVLTKEPKDWSDTTKRKVEEANVRGGSALLIARGSSNVNPALSIFKRMQRLQGGTENVYHRDELFFRPGHTPSSKEASRLYDPGEAPPQDDEQRRYGDLSHLTPDEQAQEQSDWDENVKELLAITPNLTPEERDQVLRLNPKDWDDSTSEKVHAAVEQPQQHARGTSNVGLNIFKNAQRYAGGTNYVGGGSAGTSPGPMWYPGINLPPMVKTILNTNPYYQAVKAGVLAPQALWRLGGSIGHLMNKLFPGGPSSSGGGDDPAGTPAPAGTTAPPQDKPPPSAGVGIDPWGNPADPGEWWSNDFGRWTTDKTGDFPGSYNLAGPGGEFGTHGLPSGHTVQNWDTAIGLAGSYGGGSNAGDTSRFASGAGYNRPYTAEQWADLPGSKKYAAPALTNAFGGVTPRASYEQYLQMFHPIGTVGSSTGPGGAAYSGGGPKGIGGGTPGLKPANQKAFAMGTSDVNPGLKIFHQKLLKKPKQKEKTQ